MRLGVFGGSFDPVGLHHLYVAQQLLDRDIVDHVMFVPAYISYFKKNYVAHPYQRVEMLNLAIDEWVSLGKFMKDSCSVSTLEIDLELTSVGTYGMLHELSKRVDKNVDMYCVFGSDAYSKIDTFVNSKKLLSEYKFVVVSRGVDVCCDESVCSVNICDRYSHSSSSAFRGCMLSGQYNNASKMVPESVMEYIFEREIYA